MNRHFAAMLSALSAEEVEFLLVGAHALATHGVPRMTVVIDICVRPTAPNSERVWRALVRFRAPLAGVTSSDFARAGIVFQIGVPPRRIDLLTAIDGVEFEAAYERRLVHRTGGLSIPVLGREDLIANERAAGRPKDLADVQLLERGTIRGDAR